MTFTIIFEIILAVALCSIALVLGLVYAEYRIHSTEEFKKLKWTVLPILLCFVICGMAGDKELKEALKSVPAEISKQGTPAILKYLTEPLVITNATYKTVQQIYHPSVVITNSAVAVTNDVQVVDKPAVTAPRYAGNLTGDDIERVEKTK